MAGAVLTLSARQIGSCREAVRAFLCPMGQTVYAVQAELATAYETVFDRSVWTSGEREISDIADEVASWILDRSHGPTGLSATITVWDGEPNDG